VKTQKSSFVLGLLLLIAVILLGFIAGKLAVPPEPAPTYTLSPTYTNVPTYTPWLTPTSTPLSDIATKLDYPLNMIAGNYPRVDGSTSTEFLQKIVYCHIYELNCYWRFWGDFGHSFPTFFIDGSYFGTDTSHLVPSNTNWGHYGTHDSYMNLINGNADFILVARTPSADELIAAEKQGVGLDTKAVALDAFIFIVHADNPIDTINLDQVRGIYTGQITNWKQIGGTDMPIHAYQRDKNSGSQELMMSLVMGNIPMIDAPELVLNTMAGPYYALEGLDLTEGTPRNEEDKGGIGYSVFYYAWYMMGPRQDIKILGINGVRPTSKSIADSTYPLVTEVYAVVRSNLPKDNPSILLRDWLLTSDGQIWAVEASGYVPIIKELR